VLELQRLTRRYGDLVALDGLSFTVAEGQEFGFVGSNGPTRPPHAPSSWPCSNPRPAKSDGADTDEDRMSKCAGHTPQDPRPDVFSPVRKRSSRERTRCLSYEG